MPNSSPLSSFIASNAHSNIQSLDMKTIKRELAYYGVILVRGFELTLEDYSEFTRLLCKKVTLDPARQFVSDNVQLVDSGLEEISLHCENGLTPFIPDILLFMCDIPAKQGSATTYCDGELVWANLSPDAKTYFTTHRFFFSRVIPKALWTRYLANELGITDLSRITHQLVEQISARLPQHQFEWQENGDLLANLTIDLVHPSIFSDQLNFANSLIGPSINYQKPEVKDEKGNPIPPIFIEEFKRISEQLTKEHIWEKHDILLIDNTRFMHGRRHIEDPNRKIYASIGYL